MPLSDTLPPAYQQSTQFRHWRFSPKDLKSLRESRSTFILEKERGQDDETLAYLSIDEELAYCQFYEKRLLDICKRLKFSEIVMATAVIYMKRFFLRFTAAQHHPKDVLLTCLFLAMKSEGERMSIDEFGKNLRLQSTSSVLELEFKVSQGLHFEYQIHHPYRAAHGFFLDMQSHVDQAILKDTYDKVPSIIADILLTDLPFLFQPSQLALGAFFVASKDSSFQEQFHKYLANKYDMIVDQLEAYFEKIAKALDELEVVSTDKAKEIDGRLRSYTNWLKSIEATSELSSRLDDQSILGANQENESLDTDDSEDDL